MRPGKEKEEDVKLEIKSLPLSGGWARDRVMDLDTGRFKIADAERPGDLERKIWELEQDLAELKKGA